MEDGATVTAVADEQCGVWSTVLQMPLEHENGGREVEYEGTAEAAGERGVKHGWHPCCPQSNTEAYINEGERGRRYDYAAGSEAGLVCPNRDTKGLKLD